MRPTLLLRFALPILATATASLFGMNNADLIKLKDAGLTDDTILLAVAKEPADYDTSPDGLIALKKAGLSEKVIQQIVAGGQSEAREAAAAPATADAVQPAGPAFASLEMPSIAPPVIDPVAGKDYFLRSTLFFEDGKHMGTNYSRGVLVPINTPVRIESIKKNTITLRRLDTSEPLKVENVEKYTRKGVNELARTLFSAAKTPIEMLPAPVAAAIKQGELRKGMTKEVVLMTRGCPPAHETPSLEGNRWIYWSSRFVKLTIVFNEQGRLSEGRGLY